MPSHSVVTAVQILSILPVVGDASLGGLLRRAAGAARLDLASAMKIQQLLDHHGIGKNPFAEEDAQTDPIFKEHCIASTYHPTWDKVYGDPTEPSTSIVFGEKGSGKTAMRLQVARHLENYNRSHPGEHLYVIEYDDFNPFLDRFRERLGGRRRADRVLAEWKLWDHMDAILSLGVTELVDRILDGGQANGAAGCKISEVDVRRLDRHQGRDLLLAAACYDQSTAETFPRRWHRLRHKLRFWTIKAHWDFALGILITMAVVALAVMLTTRAEWGWRGTAWLLGAGWAPWMWRAASCLWRARAIVNQTFVGNRQIGELRRVLMNFTPGETASQPLPNKQRTDDRYEMLAKFQGILGTLGFRGIVVLVDRVDEPYLINGSAELMRALMWPMLDNKFLKQPGIGLKLMLPIELSQFIQREDRDFFQRARLDKQNMILSLEWTGEALYDVANARLKACASDGASPTLRDLLDPSISDQRLIDALRRLRVPRHLFKFLYRLLMAHSSAHTDEQPVWRISSEMFESVLAVYSRDQDAFDRGLAAG